MVIKVFIRMYLFNVYDYKQGCMKDMKGCEWLQQWTELARKFAFQFNPALQPRATIVYGCITKAVTDSEIKEMLRMLGKVYNLKKCPH